MRGKSSSAETAVSAWHRVRISWPFERVPVELEIVHPRKLTALEWALLRVMDAFPDSPPPLAEIAEELGLAEPDFLRDSLRDVVRLRALAPRQDGAKCEELTELEFTPLGRDLFRRGLIEGRPTSHPEDFWFDALTDEARPRPKIAKDDPTMAPPIAAEALQPRTTVGLERAREIVRHVHPELLRGGGEVRSVQASVNRAPAIAWVLTDVEFQLTEQGALRPASANLTSKALEWLTALDPVAVGLVPPRAHSSRWDRPDLPRSGTRLTHDEWRRIATRPLPVDAVSQELLRLIGTAQREVILHAGWYGDAEVQARLAERAKAGLRVFVVGEGATRVVALHEAPRPGVLVLCSSAQPSPAAVVVDGRTGIRMDEVALNFGERRIHVEVVATMSPQACEQAKAQLVAAAATSLSLPRVEPVKVPPKLTPTGAADPTLTAKLIANPQIRLHLARLALLGQAADLAPMFDLAKTLALGPERVSVLAKLAELARAFVADIDAVSLQVPAIDAWQALVNQMQLDKSVPAHYAQLAMIAPRGATAAAFVTACLAGLSDEQGEDAWSTCRFLQQLRDVVDRRWGKGACQQEPAFAKHLELRMAQLPQPVGAADLARWFENLRAIAPMTSDIQGRCIKQLLRFPELRMVCERREPMWDEISRAWTALGLGQGTLVEWVGAKLPPPRETATPRNPSQKRRRP